MFLDCPGNQHKWSFRQFFPDLIERGQSIPIRQRIVRKYKVKTTLIQRVAERFFRGNMLDFRVNPLSVQNIPGKLDIVRIILQMEDAWTIRRLVATIQTADLSKGCTAMRQAIPPTESNPQTGQDNLLYGCWQRGVVASIAIMNVADMRKDYTAGELDSAHLAADPLAQFQLWFAEAATSGSYFRRVGIALFKLWQAVLGRPPVDANAMTLATVDIGGRPSSRTVLLKGADHRGFIFFTNYESRKGNELAANPNAALTFYWPSLERQVCVTGTVTKLSATESESYFKSRPRGSQLAAWASKQSSPVENRAALEKFWQEAAARFPGDIPLPPFWGGFVLSPARIEFWQGRSSRLHDRFLYTKQPDGSWKIQRLNP